MTALRTQSTHLSAVLHSLKQSWPECLEKTARQCLVICMVYPILSRFQAKQFYRAQRHLACLLLDLVCCPGASLHVVLRWTLVLLAILWYCFGVVITQTPGGRLIPPPPRFYRLYKWFGSKNTGFATVLWDVHCTN